MLRSYFVIVQFLLLFVFQKIQSQSLINESKDYFRSPLDIPILLSGNFGELRNNHFHSGLDIKTGGVEGKKIYAVADGYVSRIKISTSGYGKALYITHPNGYVSVYAHLKSYSGAIAKYVKNLQFQQESFEIELFPGQEELIVKKGDIVALSGNTGGSGGPHLHFEIREEKTEKAINPLLFGFNLKDNLNPVIKDIVIYPLNKNSLVNGSDLPKKIPAIGANGSFKLNHNGRLLVQGDIGIGVSGYDQIDGSGNKVGLYSIEILFDKERIYYSELDKFSFDETRYINCHIDYPAFKKQKTHTEKCFIAPNNNLSIYKDHKNRGIIKIMDEGVHSVEVVTKDLHGNSSSIQFEVYGIINSLNPNLGNSASKAVDLFKYNSENSFKNEQVIVELPNGILYNDLDFEYYSKEAIPKSITKIHHIHHEFVPVHATYNLGIRVDSLSSINKRKALIVNLDKKGTITALGGDLRNNFLYANPKTFGAFTVMIDSIPPTISPINISNGASLIKSSEIRIKIADELSGIKNYRGSIDDSWILMEYDAKNQLLFHEFEPDLSKGKHNFKLEVKDQRGNTSFYEVSFFR